MQNIAKPKWLAYIRESDCIGCSKCIPACPFDAILGSAKFMHTVIADECIGCKLCIPACPVDCIELISDETNTTTYKTKIQQAKKRYQARSLRLASAKTHEILSSDNIVDKKKYILEAIKRRKSQK